MREMKRRQFLKTAALGTSALFGTTPLPGTSDELSGSGALETGGKGYSPATRLERTAIPSACWQCVSRCSIIGYLENGRLMKIEGHPDSPSTDGKLCARGQAGINQVYNPDRLLHPMKRTGKRGEGKWKRITWNEALDLLVNGGEIAGRTVRGLKEIREAGTPEKFMFHYGRMVGSDWLINIYYFMRAYGSDTIGDHSSICMSAGGMASALSGDASSTTDIEDARVILNFGASFLDAGLDHLSRARRLSRALANGTRMYTFDVRLSNTAAMSTEWIPIKPGTDLAVLLAMCHVVMLEGLYDAGAIDALTNTTVEDLKRHFAPYTPEWAEEISSVPAHKIRSIAKEFCHAGPAMCTGFRGAFMHYNGVQAQRAIFTLRTIAGKIADTSRRGVRPRWNYPFPFPEPDIGPASLNILQGEKGAYAFPDYNVSHQIVHMIDVGPERPDLYLVYCHNPVFSNGDCERNQQVYRDEEKIPFLVAVDIVLSETSELADLVLPDATYLERWICDGRVSHDFIPEYFISQPMHPPLGEARNFCDVACDIAGRLGIDLGFESAEEFVRATCDNTPGVREAGGFEYMVANGIWCDQEAGYEEQPHGTVEIDSGSLSEAGFDAMPAWMPIPSHEEMSPDDLILTTFKVNVHTHSRTQNCKWLTEIYHKNPAWIHPETAAARSIRNGDFIRIRSGIGEITTRAYVTEGVHPKAVAVSFHSGHWAHGEYASGRKSYVNRSEPDNRLRWWKENGVTPNWIIPNVGDPIAGSMCWNDTVVQVVKA